MPPRPQAQRRNPQAQNEQVYELGVQGRKTGVTLTDTGERDEYGMEPADNIFSSDPESEDEQDMDIDEASTMGPATVSRKARERLSIPKARSPGKTFLNSPARHNPHVARTSSPIRGSYAGDGEEQPSPAKSPKRLLDFSKSPKRKPVANGHSHAKSSSQFAKGASQASKALGTKPSRVNGYVHNESDEEPTPRRKKQRSPEVEEEEEEEEDEEEEDEPMDFLNADGDDVEQDSIRDESPEEEDIPEEEESEEEPAPVEKPQPKKRGRKPKAVSPPVEEESEPEPEPARDASEEHEEPAKKKRGRPGKRPLVEEAEPVKPAKRPKGRPSLTKNKDSPDQGTSSAAEVRNAKKAKAAPKPSESKAKAPQAPQAVAAKGKPGRKPKMTDVDAEDPGAVPRRPPMPKRRSLVSQRRDEFEVKTTRSGRVSTKPLEFWRGERYDYDEEDDDEEVIEDKNGRRIKIGPKIKGVVRVEYDEDQPKRRRGRPASGSGSGGPGRRHKRRVSEIEEEEEERQEWEDEPGRMIGECIYWHPEYELNPPHDDDQVEVAEEELAISESAIQMKDIKDATFRFAKTMTLPFFGSGIVDLPPQSEKRTKNARKMQMVFFVHYGNVEVTVASTTFRISKGGTFFVPRGNHYSIKNDTDRPSRLFFCQGCEVAPPPADSQEM